MIGFVEISAYADGRDAGWGPGDVVARRIARGRERTDVRAERGT